MRSSIFFLAVKNSNSVCKSTEHDTGLQLNIISLISDGIIHIWMNQLKDAVNCAEMVQDLMIKPMEEQLMLIQYQIFIIVLQIH